MTNVAWLTNFQRRLTCSARQKRKRQRPSWLVVPKLMRTVETLEDRALLATITVTSLGNNYDLDSQVTLLEAFNAAEFDISVDGSVAGNGADVIEFAPSLFLGGDQISLLPSMVFNAQNMSAMAVSTDVTILGPSGEHGLTLAMSDLGRHFDVLATGKLTLERLTLTDGKTFAGKNSVVGQGGAIFNAGEVTIRASLLSGNNVAGGDDGGAYGGAIFNTGTLTIVNSTFAMNTAKGGPQVMGTGPGEALGGAIFNLNGTVEISNSTFSANQADDGAVYALGDNAPVVFNTTNSIFANTTNAADTNVNDVTIAVSHGGVVGSANWSGLVLEQGQIEGVAVTSNGMLGIQVVDPLLGDLQHHGGPVATIAPLAGSPIINAGVNQQVVDDGLVADGRGYESRVEGGVVDVGAYEVDANPRYVAQFGPLTTNSGEASSGLGDTDFVVPAGSQRLLAVTVMDTNAPGTAITTVALDGQPLTLVGESLATGIRTAVYVLPLGSSTTDSMSFLNVEWNQNVDGVYFTQLFRGVDQFLSVGNVVTNQSTTASADLTDGELAFSAFAANGGAGTLTSDAQQVTLQSGVFSGAQAFISTKATTGNTSLSYGNLMSETGVAHVAFDLQSASAFNPDAPRIASVARHNPTAQVTSDAQVTFRVTFNESVQNVSIEDFKVTGAAAANSGASVMNVTAQSATQYDVVVSVANNSNGTLGLGISVLQDIVDLTNLEFVGTIESAETYRIDNTAPALVLGAGVLGIDQFEVLVTANEDASLKYLLKLATDPAPTAIEINAAPTGTLGVSSNVPSTIPFTGLTEQTSYVVYFIATDTFAQESGVESIGIATLGVETTVTLDNGILVITDSNNGSSGDQLTIDYALGSYVISDPNLFLTTALVGATGDRTHSLTIPDTGIMGLRVELAGGADDLNVNSLPTSLPGGFIINGGTGDVTTLAAEINTAGANIEITADFVNLQNNLKTNAMGQITVTALRSIQGINSQIVTDVGSITLSANSAAEALGGTFGGIHLESSSITTTLGSVGLVGTSGDTGPSNVAFGVWLEATDISTSSTGTAAGSIIVNGRARQAANGPGVRLDTSNLHAVDGPLTVFGFATTGMGSTLSSSKLSITGTGFVDLRGLSDVQTGLALSNTQLLTTTGTIGVNGVGAMTGLVANQSEFNSDSGDVLISGNGTANGIDLTQSKLTNATGDVMVNAKGGSGFGFRAGSATTLSTTSGDITLSGEGTANGIEIHLAQVASTTGNIRLSTDRLQLTPVSTTMSSAGTLQLDALTSATSIGVGTGSGTLQISDAELGTLSDGFAQITLGASDDSSAIVIDNAVFTDNVTVIGSQISVTKLNATAQAVRLVASTGAISDNGDDAPDVTASSLVLDAATGIGQDGNSLNTHISQLAAGTDSGDVALSNTGDLTVTELAGIVGVRIEDPNDDDSHNDNISITTNGHLIVAKSVINLDAGDVLLEAALATTGDLTLSAIVQGRNFNFAAADDVVLNIAPSGMTGDLRIIAGTDSAAGDILQLGGINLTVTAGTITLAADGDLVIESLSSTSHVTLRSESGSILEDGDDDIDITAGTIGLEAQTGIGTDADDIDISVLHLGAVTDSGDINLGFTGSVTVDIGNGLNGVVEGVRILDLANDNSGNDTIRLTTDGQLAVTSITNQDGGQIVLTSVNGTTLLGASTLSRLHVNGPLLLDGLLALDGLPFTNGNEILVANDGTDSVSGRFTGSPESSLLTVDNNEYVLTYFGGDGNDIALVYRNVLMPFSGTENDDVFEIRRFLSGDADSIQTLLGSTIIDSRPRAANPVVDLSGHGGNDRFVLNYSGAGGYYAAASVLNGGAGVDRIEAQGGGVDRVESQLGGTNFGSVLIVPVDGVSAESWTFEETEVVDFNITAKVMNLTLSPVADTATLSAIVDLDMELTAAPGMAFRFLNPQQTLALYGGQGNDSITFQSVDTEFLGSLFVDAGDGSDTINASALTRHVGEVGGLGHDTIIGSQGFDSIDGGAGNDVITANGGDDFIGGGRGNDTISAGSGNDGIFWIGGDGNDVIDGNAGTDEVGVAGAENATQGERIELRDSSGRVAVERFTDPGINPFLLSLGTVETVEIFAFSGDDLIDARNLTLAGLSIDAGDGADVVYGGALADVLIGGLGPDTIRAGGGPDVLLGGGDSDLLDGEAGDDRVRGQGASLDVLIGGLGTDTLDGGDGTDIVSESGDQDYVLTNLSLMGTLTGTDTFVAVEDAALTGGSSSNTIDASSFTGRTTLSGGAGHDTLRGGSNVDFIYGDDGDDVIVSGNGPDNINGFAGNDSVDAGLGNDLVRGGAGRDSLIGGDGDDRLFGQGTSSDLLIGGLGNDTLSGGTGDDLLSGDAGDDVFVWEDGDGTDLVDGGSGTDRQMVYASKTSSEGDQITVADNGVRIALTRAAGTLISGFVLDLGTVERINVLLYAGNDLFDATGLTLARLNVQGGGGNDTLNGGSQNDVFAGDFGNDVIHGGAGVDVINAGGGADTVDGGNDSDTIDVSNSDAIDTVLNSALDTVFSNVDDILN